MANPVLQPDTVISLPPIFENDDIGILLNPLYEDQRDAEDDVCAS